MESAIAVAEQHINAVAALGGSDDQIGLSVMIDVGRRHPTRIIDGDLYWSLERAIAIAQKDLHPPGPTVVAGIERDQIEIAVAAEIGNCQSGGKVLIRTARGIGAFEREATRAVAQINREILGRAVVRVSNGKIQIPVLIEVADNHAADGAIGIAGANFYYRLKRAIASAQHDAPSVGVSVAVQRDEVRHSVIIEVADRDLLDGNWAVVGNNRPPVVHNRVHKRCRGRSLSKCCGRPQSDGRHGQQSAEGLG